ATAESIEKIAAAVNVPGGDRAVQLRLVDRYLKNLTKVARKENQVILPMDISNIGELFQTLDPKALENRNRA
ncbi:band-7 C-terminal domain-containing protein, partial [Arthrospira platensis SPKY1]|nr:band-7 C-terminal domain-containing protein [Arthrospira platensis SPKY1]